MAYIDVFNGDADGICALHQLRLAHPVKSTLVTGVKRDINLLKKVHAETGDKLTVLDISLDKNRQELLTLLDKNVSVLYFDHHFAGDIPVNNNLKAHIDTDANACSSLLVNDYLAGKFLPWAVTAAFGDNLFDAAEKAALPLNLSKQKLEQLKLLGTCINYNGYGATLEDLIFTPEALYKMIEPYDDPFEFLENEKGYQVLLQGYKSDITNAELIKPQFEDEKHALYSMSNEKWCRRVSGVYANQLAQNYPQRAHAILSENDDGDFVVSVRAPLNNKTGADELCRQFDTGGGRKAAAGINCLPKGKYEIFLNSFKKSFLN